ncbi:MAG: hypothetical protein L6R35_002760 [Caloplaca aegaea]|nr:MAG: hypothetical protein L6R35_002760 [Caloplaca aegaea]
MISLLKALHTPPWPPSTAIAPALDKCQPIEEERTPYYAPKRFYPAYLGEILNDRYQVATKVGYGTNSTVWLARDLHQLRWSADRYVAVKINAVDRAGKKVAETELRNMQLISKSNPRHEGRHFVRTLLDSFTLSGTYNEHICLVFEPLREPIWLLNERFKGNVIPSGILKIMVQMLLHGLDYLHTECHIVHTDLKPDNIMVRLEDKSILERDARDEMENPLPQKKYDDRTIYLSRNNYGQPGTVTGIVSITDFGHSVRGDDSNHGCIQAEVYRAPEVILEAGWTYSGDIWNLGVMLWDSLENKTLFEAVDPLKSTYDDRTHLAHITALLGPPPQDFLALGKRTSMFYDPEGKLKGTDLTPQNFTLESSVSKIDGQDKRMFLAFVSRMLTWQPEDRSTAKELLSDPWLRAGFAGKNK